MIFLQALFSRTTFKSAVGRRPKTVARSPSASALAITLPRTVVLVAAYDGTQKLPSKSSTERNAYMYNIAHEHEER